MTTPSSTRSTEWISRPAAGRRPVAGGGEHRAVAGARASAAAVGLLLLAVGALATSAARAGCCPGEGEGPVACDDTFQIGDEGDVVLDVTANDSHPRGVAMQLVGVSPGDCPAQLTALPEGTIRFRLDPGVSFPDGGCTLHYQLSDGQQTSCAATVEVKSLAPKSGGVIANDDTILVDNTVSPLPTEIEVDVSELLANDEPPGEAGISQVSGATLEPEGHVVYAVPPGFWSNGGSFDYVAQLLSDPEQTDTATVELRPTGLQAVDDDLVVPLGSTSYNLPVADLLANDSPPGLLQVESIFDPHLPFLHTLRLLGDHISYQVPEPGVQGEVGEFLGTFRYRVERTDGVPGTSEAEVRLEIGAPSITARRDFVVVAHGPLDSNGVPANPKSVVVPFAPLLANDFAVGPFHVSDLDPLIDPVSGFHPSSYWSLGWTPANQESQLVYLNNCCTSGQPVGCSGTCSVSQQNFWQAGMSQSLSYTIQLNETGEEAAAGVILLTNVVPADDFYQVPSGGQLDLSFLSTDPASPLANDVGFKKKLSGFPVLPAHGVLEQLGLFTARYKPSPGFTGEDAFAYEIRNSVCLVEWEEVCPRATATIHVDVVPILARPDAVEVDPAATAAVVSVADLLADDEPAGQVEAVGVDPPQLGELEVTDPDPVTGSYRYTPQAAFSTAGVDFFRQWVAAAASTAPPVAEKVFLLRQAPAGALLTATSFDGGGDGIEPPWETVQQGPGGVQLSPEAAIGGLQGVEFSVSPGSQTQSLRDETPLAESHYHARFVVDPSGLALADGDEMVLFEGTDHQVAVVRLWLAGGKEGMRLRLQGFEDDGSAFDLPPGGVLLPDGPVAVHLEWWAPSFPGQVGGGARLWVDGQPAGESTYLDNGLDRVSVVAIGAVGSLPPAVQGRLLLDDFASWRGDRTCEGRLAEGFETRTSLDSWSPSAAGVSLVDVTPQAAMDGNQGLGVRIVDGLATVRHPVAERSAERVVTELWLSPGTFAPGDSRWHYVLALRSPDDRRVAWLRLRKNGGQWELDAVARLADGSSAVIPPAPVPLSPEPHRLRFDWEAKPDGSRVALRVDGQLAGEGLDLANRQSGVLTLVLGADAVEGGVAPNTQGTLYFDEVSVCSELWQAGPPKPPEGP